MNSISQEHFSHAIRWGRPATATVQGLRKSGYFLGNRFICTFNEQPIECVPQEFRQLRVWRK